MNPTALMSHATLTTERLRLEPQGIQHFDGLWEALSTLLPAADRAMPDWVVGLQPDYR